MTRRPHCIGLICVAVLSGCQSLDTPVLPWQTSKETKYTAEQIAAMNNPQPVAARAVAGNEDQRLITATASSRPVSSGRVEQLIQSGQATLRNAQTPFQLARARQDFQEALDLDDSNASAHHGVAIVADLQEDWSAAEDHYKQALRQRPQDPGILNDLGYSYLLQNRYYESSQYLNQALQVAPGYEHAHINLALLSLKRGDRVGAETRLSDIYSPEDVNTTLARLEDDLRSENGDAVRADTSQPRNTSFEDTKRLMAEERERAQRARQEKLLREQQRLATERQQAPSGGMTLPQTQYGRPQQNTAGYPVTADSEGTLTGHIIPPTGYLPRSPSNSPQSSVAATSGSTLRHVPGNNYPMGHFPTQVARDSAAGVVPASSTTGLSTHAPQQMTPSSAAPSQYGQQAQYDSDVSPPRGLIQQVTQQQNLQDYGSPQSSAPVPQNHHAPVAGLNAGPGALFPIGAGSVSPGAAGLSQTRSMNSQVPGQTQFQGQNNGVLRGQTLVPGTNTMINGAMYQQPQRVLPAAQHMQQMQQMQYERKNSTPMNPQPMSAVPVPGRSAFGAGGVLNAPGLSPQHQAPIQQVAGNAATMQTAPQGMQPSGSQYGVGQTRTGQPGSIAAPSPLAAYEQQLRGLNSQYNQAIQQVDGTRDGLQPVQARY
ncbi:MAG: hypothetical protein GY758_18255 [Fuerstiella sp.]|nr:hypothetical protein [Fuerstiella sp.]MCP4782842.1 hypothetical protein [Fuerstiella sp.]MCP4853720.1 hypothetical protein [Fuerstiella sp.]